MPKHRLLGLLVAALTIAPVASASAAPATIDLRVEGQTRTLFEGKVTTDVRTFKFTGDPVTHVCDGTSALGGTSPVPAPTAGGAIATASETTPFAMTGLWYAGLGASFTTIDGDNTAYDIPSMSYLVEYYNGAPSMLGACGQAVKTGDSYLFAYGTGAEPLLKLTGPATAAPGAPATLRVVNAADGTPVAGATVAGQTTGLDGTVVVTASAQRGTTTPFKAAKAGTIRSNRLDVCATDGADGFCGTAAPAVVAAAAAAAPPAPVAAVVPDAVAAFAKIGAITEGKRFAEGVGPRTLQGRVDADASGLKDVRLRLSRTDGSRCSRYDGTRERFVTTSKCGVKNARTFSVGTQAAFSYLLPSALPRGRYVLDVIVVDGAGNQTATYQRGRNRVVFNVG